MGVNTETTATTDTSSSSEPNANMKTVSAPVNVLPQEPMVKEKVSAPSYLHSLRENELPPFARPEKEPKPKLLCCNKPLLDKNDVIEMVAAADNDPAKLRAYLAGLVVKKKVIMNYELSERNFLVKLLMETVDYAAQRDFPAKKLSCLLTLYLTTHMYFKWYYWSAPLAIWEYFKELMIRHTIEDSPDGQEVFDPQECYDILTHFHAIYITNLPLVHIATFGSYRLRLGWPFKWK